MVKKAPPGFARRRLFNAYDTIDTILLFAVCRLVLAGLRFQYGAPGHAAGPAFVDAVVFALELVAYGGFYDVRVGPVGVGDVGVGRGPSGDVLEQHGAVQHPVDDGDNLAAREVRLRPECAVGVARDPAFYGGAVDVADGPVPVDIGESVRARGL